MNFNDPEQIEAFQRLYIKPMVDEVKSTLAPLVETQRDHGYRLEKLEGNQKKALLGYAGVVAVGTIAFNYIKVKWLSKFFQ
jgi:hypothetical protein